MAKLPDIKLTRGDWGTPTYVELSVPCRVLKDGVFRGTFPDQYATQMKQFYETQASELVDKTLDGLVKELSRFIDWLAESTKVSTIVMFYESSFNGEFNLSANKLIEPAFANQNEWNKSSMSFESKAAVAFGARLRVLTVTTGRGGSKTYTVAPVGSDSLGEFGKRLLSYDVGPEIRQRHMHPDDMLPFVEYTEALAESFVEDIESVYYKAVDLREKLQNLKPMNGSI